jgi:uncharacterized protein (UPF0548 family)
VFLIRRPSDDDVRTFVQLQSSLAFSYAGVGSSRDTPPAGYTVDHNRVQLGEGEETFRRATAAIRAWRMFELGWVELLWPDAPIEPHASVAVLVRWCGLWCLNACRVVYVLDEPTPIRRFGLAYGTLPEHAERGEERFSVEWRADDTVWYDLLAFSQPNQWHARVGRPLSRRLQKRFARDSMRAMVKAVALRSEP